MSKPTETTPEVREVADDDDAPPLMPGQEGEKIDEAALRRAAGQAAGKGTKRYAKAMAKLGLKPEPGVFRVQIKKTKGTTFSIVRPEVYRFPGTNTFVLFGETTMEEGSGDAKSAAAAVTGTAPPAAAAAAAVEPAAAAASATPAAAGEDDDSVDAGDLAEKDIKIVMQQANVTRGRAIRALKNNKGDIVNTIMELTM